MNSQSKSKRKNKLFSNFLYDFVKITGAVPAYIWMRPKMHYPFGKPSLKGRIMAISNHPTFFDPITVHLAFPMRRLYCLASKDVFNTEFKVRFFTQMHCIVIDKQNFSINSFRDVVSRLEEDRFVVVFPEGTVNTEGKEPMLAFKSGAVFMAHRAGAPIIPLYIVKNKKWWHRQHMVMGQPIDVVKLAGNMPSIEDFNRVTDTLREEEDKLRVYFESLCEKKK